MATKGRATMSTATDKRTLYKEGDVVPLEFQIYPGPREFKTYGIVLKRLSPTYYEIEFVDEHGRTKTRRFTRGHLR